MPRYYFDTIGTDRTDRDPDGIDLADEHAARCLAWGCLADLMADLPEPPEGSLIIRVGDAARRPIFEVYAAATMTTGSPLPPPGREGAGSL